MNLSPDPILCLDKYFTSWCTKKKKKKKKMMMMMMMKMMKMMMKMSCSRRSIEQESNKEKTNSSP